MSQTQAIGPDVHLMLDANNAWADLPTALTYCKRFEKYNPYWIEEPFSPDDIENHSKLTSRTSISTAGYATPSKSGNSATVAGADSIASITSRPPGEFGRS